MIFSYQPALRPALPCVYGPLDYRELRALFQHIDSILSSSGLEEEFIALSIVEHKIDTSTATAARLESFARHSVLALRSNIARTLTGLDHREFATRLADSSLLQWFLRVGEMGSIKAFSKSTSNRLSCWVTEQAVRDINEKLSALLAFSASQAGGAGEAKTPAAAFGLAAPIRFDDIYFDSTCLKADIHFPIDWVLLRDAARTLTKATTLIRKHGLKHRMPQEPLDFLSDMNTLCMKMSAKNHAADGRKHRKKILREMKELGKRGKAGAQVEFGNKLWLGETREGIIADYQLHEDNPSDTALVNPALERLIDTQRMAIGNIWGDRGLASKSNTVLLEKRGIGNGLCPRNPGELADKLSNQEGFRAGLKRRAATEGRIGIFKNVFLGRPLRAKGFEHRKLAVGWAVLTHNLWVVARLAEAEKKRKEENKENTKRKPDKQQKQAA